MVFGRMLVVLAALACLAGAMEWSEYFPSDDTATEDLAGADPVEEPRPETPFEEDPFLLAVALAPRGDFERHPAPAFGAGTGVGPRHGHLRDVHRPPEA